MVKMKEEKLNRTKGTKIAFAIILTIFALYTFFILFAISWTFLQSLKGNKEFWRDMISLPKDWLFANYATAFSAITYNKVNLFGMFFNSLIFSVGMSLLSVFMHCVTGYVFAKYKFFAKEAVFSFVIFTLILPIVGNLPALYKLVYNMGINDSILFMVTALGGFGGNFLITYAFFKNIDWSYAEACFIDGGGHFYVFFRIMLPLAVGPIFALSIVGVIFQWNNYETPMLFLDKMPTLASGLLYYRAVTKATSSEPIYFAGVLMATVPVLVLVSIFGNKIMTNMTIGGVKG